jgi:CRISPR-associated protein Csb2
MKYLCIAIQWLDDRYHGKDADGEPEWPPSPLRLFQAMLAGAFRRFGESDSFLESFRWLQSKNLPAPTIVSPRAQDGRPFTRFVPNNDSDKELDRQGRLTAKKVQPTFLLDPSPIHYIWRLPEPLSDDDLVHVDVLCEIVKNIVAFGWGVDMAFSSGSVISDGQVSSLKGERWLPNTEMTGARRRIPGPATLDALIDRYRLEWHCSGTVPNTKSLRHILLSSLSASTKPS